MCDSKNPGRHRGFGVRRLLLVVWLGIAAQGAAAQSKGDPDLGALPFGHMHMLLEKTIFKVDVLTLDVCLDARTAEAIAPWARTGAEGSMADSIADVAMAAPSATGLIRFRRGVSLGQFLDGIRDEQKKAVDAGLLERATFDMITDSLPAWFDFLQERGIHEDDRIAYEFRGDSLRTIFRDAGGPVLLDRTDVGSQRRISVLATWFAPGSAFRRPLLRSLDPLPAPAAACSLEGS